MIQWLSCSMVDLRERTFRPLLRALFLLLAFTSSNGVQAQSARDPTAPPAEVSPAATIAGGVNTPQEPARGSFIIIVRNGQFQLVVGTRLYAKGQKLGNATIERISETEVWFREGQELRKIRQFKAVELRSAMPETASLREQVCANSVLKPEKSANPSATRAQPPMVSCVDDQPRGLNR